MQNSESHTKKNYLAKVNQWYNTKLAVIDDKLRKRPITPRGHKPFATKKQLKKQASLKKKNEEIDNDDSPVKRVKLERSPMSRTKFPPIQRMGTNLESGGESPFRKYYEDPSLNKRKSLLRSEDSFGTKLISLKKTPFITEDAPYRDNQLLAQRRGLELWKAHREKKIVLNRSEEQLQKTIAKWGNKKSFHQERALTCADRQSIVYNDHSRSFKRKEKSPRKDDLSNSVFVNQEKFLETDDESLKSSEDEGTKVNKTRNNDYEFNEEQEIDTLMHKLHDMSYMTTDHDVHFGSSFAAATGDDSFFLTKKNIEGDESPTKKGEEKEIKPNYKINPILNVNRIQKFRNMKGNLVGANKVPDPENIDTIFNTDTALKRHISLSLYTRPKSLLDRKPAQNDYMDEEMGTLSLRRRAGERNASVQNYQSNHSVHRTKQIDEIGDLKNLLTKQDINCSVMTIEKAILFPEDRPETIKTYPRIGEMLFKNPFETKKKKKKKKGKKKK